VRAFSQLGSALPKGRTLPPAVWERRHAWMLRLVWAHVVGLLVWGLLAGNPLWHAAVDAGPVFVCGAIAMRGRLSRRSRAVAVCVGLLTSSAVVVHLMHGAIEGHFHFFVMVSVLALYEEWFPYLLAFAFVLGHHGLMGAIDPASVYNHPDAVAHPWRWASIHALFIGALGIVNLVHWRLNEDARGDALHSQERFRQAFDDAPTGMALVDLDGVVERANAALCERVGADPAGRPLADLVHADDLADRQFPAASGETELRYRDGGAWGLWHHSLLTGRDGRPEGWITHCIDVSERKHAEEELSWHAHHDALTGLPNRELFLERLGGAIGPERGRVAVLLVDLDDFKVVNDSLGHGAGDRLLSGVAERLCRVLRPDDVIARFGGDEFTVLLRGITSESYAIQVAQRLADALREPLVLDGERRYVTASIGVSFSGPGEDGVDPNALLRDADAAMYRAKELGKSRCEVFDDSMRQRALERLELESGLGHALDDGELRLVYQPLVTLADGRVTGVEALLRWDHPVHGVVAPLRFVGLAERNGLIIPIGAWVLQEACHQLATWGDDALSMSVNVSARQLGSTDLVKIVRAVLEESGIAPSRLCLEITETAMMADPGAIGETLSALKQLGVRLAVDDFGVGHASLRQLRALLPVDTLKIDKSFVDGITDDADDAAIVEGVVRLAHSLGLQAVAEGVETPEQLAMLRAWSCQTGQGYHFARPAEPAEIARMLAASPAVRSAA
jgi:diguanylate cyclase (GGDEF)-like protein/PAS domain S-box-containing protein